jgi:mannan endo-1,4-beta-mannosidase
MKTPSYVKAILGVTCVACVLNPSLATATSAPRPSYNTGVGFYVVGNKIYDANGNEFRVRGVDKNHIESNFSVVAKTHANTVRVFGASDFPWFTLAQETNYNSTLITNKQVPVITADSIAPPTPMASWTCPGTSYAYTSATPGQNAGTSGNTDPALLNCIVQYTWVAQASTWAAAPYDKAAMINIANEWGPSVFHNGATAGATWVSALSSAITAMRNAGYKQTLVVDSGSWGEDPENFLQYGQQVFNSDPQKNIVFSLHPYQIFCDPQAPAPYSAVACNAGILFTGYDIDTLMSKLAALPFPVILGEFGAGRNINPSNDVDPRRIVQVAEKYGLGWMGWAIDDGTGYTNTALNMLYVGNTYNASSDLSIWGQELIEGCANPSPAGCGCPSYTGTGPWTCTGTPAPQYTGQGILQLATPATIFTTAPPKKPNPPVLSIN